MADFETPDQQPPGTFKGGDLSSALDDPLEEFALVEATCGFMPPTFRELTEAFELLGYPKRKGATAGYLNDIFLHQTALIKQGVSEVVDPRTAVETVTREYVGYYWAALRSTNRLNALESRLSDVTGHESNVAREIGVGQPGLLELVRFVSLKTILLGSQNPFQDEDGQSEDTFDPPLINSARIMEFANNTKVTRARGLIVPAIQDQGRREFFWHERLVEAEKHDLAISIAEIALRS